MSTTVTPNDFLIDRDSILEWLAPVLWQIWDQIWDHLLARVVFILIIYFTWLLQPYVEILKLFSIYICLTCIVEYYAKKRMSREAVDALERLTKGKNFKVKRGKKGITIQVCTSGFGHEDLKFAMVKKHLVIKGETTNLHGKSIKYETSVPVSDWKKYDMRGLVAESKNGLVKVFIPFSKK